MAGSGLTIPESLTPLIEKVGGKQRAALLIVGVVVAASIFGVSRWATAPQWAPAFTNMPMESVSEMTDKLQQSGIPFKLEKGGTEILVNEKDLARARVTLAKDGLPTKGRPGLELFDQPSWGMTDFTQRINYRRALEGELERTIGQMRGVEAAQVHLALHEQSNFRRQDKPANASVVLKTSGTVPPSPEVVQGIAHLVAGSVDGLTSDRVSVIDDSGRLLSEQGENGSLAALSNAQLKMQRDVESYLQSKAQDLINDMVGVGNARVKVNADLNFDRVDRQSQIIDPDRQATATEQRQEVGGVEGTQGASSNMAISYENTKVTESYSGSIGNIRKLSVAVLVNDKISSAATTETSDQTATESIKRTPEELAHIESLVRSAVGADSERGDVVTVISSQFGAEPSLFEERVKEDAAVVESPLAKYQYPILAAIVALVLVIGTLIGFKVFRKKQAEPPALEAKSTHEPRLAAPETVIPLPKVEEEPVFLDFLNRANLQRTVVSTIETKPNVSARAIRIWMKEG